MRRRLTTRFVLLVSAVAASLMASGLPSRALTIPTITLPPVPVVDQLLGSNAPTYPGATVHPRLLITKSEIPALKARINASSTLSAAFTRLKQKADDHLIKVQPQVVAAGIHVDQDLQGLECPYCLQNEMSSYLIELGMTYQLTGDTRYGRRVVDLLLALAQAKFPFWSGQDLGIGDLDEGLGLGFDLSYELMTPAERSTFIQAVNTYQEELLVTPLFKYTNQASTYVTSNWSGVLGGGSGLLLLALKGEPNVLTGYTSPARASLNPTVPAFPQTHYVFNDYMTQSVAKVSAYFHNGIDPLGGNHEGHTYSHYGLKNSVPFANAWRRDGNGDLIAGTGLPNLARWASFEQLPGQAQQFVPLNDSQRNEFGVDYESLLFGIAPSNGIAQWLWQRTVGPKGNNYDQELRAPAAVGDDACVLDRPTTAPVSTPSCFIFHTNGDVWELLYYRTPAETPEVVPSASSPLSVHYDALGLVDARTGFANGANEVISTFDARRNGIGHFQLDEGSFTLYGYGASWGIDPGYSCIGCGDTSPNGYPVAHNDIVIDGSQDTQDVYSRYYNGQTIDQYLNATNFSLAHADLGYSYSFTAPYAGRDHLFVRTPGRPVIMATNDQIQRSASGTHTYTWQMLTDKLNVPVTSADGFTIRALNGANLVGHAATPGTAPSFQLRTQLLQNENDDIGPAPVLYTTSAAQGSLDQLTVLALTPSGAAAATQTTLAEVGGNAIAVDWNGLRDIVVTRLHGSSAASGAVSMDGEVGKLTVARGESLLRNGTILSTGGVDYIVVTGAAATVTVSGNAITATGPATNAYKVYAPQSIGSVTVNGATVTSCRSGAYVSFPC